MSTHLDAMFLLPGLEAAMEALVVQINEARQRAGMATMVKVLHQVSVMGNKPNTPIPSLALAQKAVKRKLSAQGRANIAAAQKKRWAAKKAQSSDSRSRAAALPKPVKVPAWLKKKKETK